MPSVVASGTTNSPRACSPLTSSGPASPIGTCATPTKFSMLPRVSAGSKENLSTCWSFTPVCPSRKSRRLPAHSREWSSSFE